MVQSGGWMFNLSCHAKQDMHNMGQSAFLVMTQRLSICQDQTHVRYGISKISPLDYYEEVKLLRDLLMTLPWAQGA